jgi:hypothetical protein
MTNDTVHMEIIPDQRLVIESRVGHAAPGGGTTDHRPTGWSGFPVPRVFKANIGQNAAGV